MRTILVLGRGFSGGEGGESGGESGESGESGGELVDARADATRP